MKKLLVLLALCMVFSLVLVACQEEPGTEETTTTSATTEAPTTGATTEAPTTEAPTTEAPTTEAPTTEPGTETSTEEVTTEPTTETDPVPTETETETDPVPTETETDPVPTETETETEPVTTETETETEKPVDPVYTHVSFDECDMWIGGTNVGNFFTPGQSNTWDKIANVEDYNVEFIRIWGWVGFYNETIGEFGYQIDDNDPVYDAAFTWETGDDVKNAAAAGGAKSASRFQVMVPVRELSGEHTIKFLIKDAVGTVETFVEFTMNKAVDPNAPVAFIPAADMAASIPGSPDITSAVMSADGSYITITTGTIGDPYYQLPMLNQKGVVASFVAIKYRTTVEGIGSEIFVGSGASPSGAGDNITFDLVGDGKWQVAIVDLSRASAVVDGVVNYLRWDPFREGTNNVIDMAYIALFNSAEAAQDYFDKTMVVADNTDSFYSDASNYDVGTALSDTDLSTFFTMNMPTGGSFVVDLGDGLKAYEMANINEMLVNMNGAYYVYANVVSSTNPASFVVRGYQVVNSDAIIEAFDPAAGLYKINNYYETDGNPGKCGGSGIYVNIYDGKLQILAKVYNPEKTTRVDNAILEIPCDGTGLTIVDDGYTVYIAVDGILYATIDLIGAQSYADINEVSPAGQFAAKAIVKTVDNEYVLENTLIAANISQVAVVARAGGIKFTNIEIGGFSQTIVPEFPNPVEEIEPIFYDGENGFQTVPAGGKIQFAVRNAAGLNMIIEGAAGLAVTADNTMGTVAPLTEVEGNNIVQFVPGVLDWGFFLLTIENTTDADVEINLTFTDPAAEEMNNTLALGENTVVVTVENYYCAGVDMTFTAAEAGTYTFGGDAAFLWCLEKEEGFSTPWTVEMAEGETLTINISVDDVMAIEGGNGEATINLNITKA